MTVHYAVPAPPTREGFDNHSRRRLPMYRLTVVYDEPADKAAFDRRYTNEHVPLVKASPGLVRFQLSHPQGGAPYLVAELFWNDEDAFRAWAATPERAEVRNHAEGCGTTFTTYTGDVAVV
jgi:uncharacterized protein (TIGR02118 family)